jgi:hypothetical protein
MPLSSNSMVGIKYNYKINLTVCQMIITFICRLRLTLIIHFGIKVRIIQIIVHNDDATNAD